MYRVVAGLFTAVSVLAACHAGAQPPASWPEASMVRVEYDLSQARILVIVGEEFNQAETLGMSARWKGWKARVDFAGPARTLLGEPGEAPGGAASSPAPTLRVDHLLPEVDASRYDLVYVAGGEGVAKLLESSRPDLRRIFDAAAGADRLIAAICHGPTALAASDVVRGKRVTVQGEPGRAALQRAGATVVDEIVVVDGALVTGQWPHLETFAMTVAERLLYPGGGGPFQQALAARPPIVRAIDELRPTHRFDARQVPLEAIEQIGRATMKTLAAPTTRGALGLRIVAVREPATKAAVGSTIFAKSRADFAARGIPEAVLRRQLTALFDQAPVLLFLFARGTRGDTTPPAGDSVLADVAYAGGAAANLALAAQALGLGVAPLGLPTFLAAEPEIKRTLEVTDASRLVGIIALGWPSLSGTPAVARPLSELIAFERWNGVGPR